MKILNDFTLELRQLNERLGTDFAIVSYINGADYEVVEVESTFDAIDKGSHFESINTYCNEVLQQQNTIIHEHVGTISSMIKHPIYMALQLEVYIGVPLLVGGNIVGTLNFSGFNPKTDGFSEEEINQVKELAQRIEKVIVL